MFNPYTRYAYNQMKQKPAKTIFLFEGGNKYTSRDILARFDWLIQLYIQYAI